MLFKLSCFAVVGVCLLVPSRIMAGGPPCLWLPIDGVTPDNAEQCARSLAKALGRTSRDDGIKMVQDKKQWYARVFLEEDVTLTQIEHALKESEFSIPQRKLRLFGHVVLEVDTGKTQAKELITNLEAIKYVAVAESERKDGILLITVDMPYPVAEGRSFRESVAWDTFRRNDFSSNPSTRSEPPATAGMLPSYHAFRTVAEKHNANLKDIRWSARYVCRPLGCVAVQDPEGKVGKAATQ
jgi:hypothetical protein